MNTTVDHRATESLRSATGGEFTYDPDQAIVSAHPIRPAGN
jgi:hypothetical protein